MTLIDRLDTAAREFRAARASAGPTMESRDVLVVIETSREPPRTQW